MRSPDERKRASLERFCETRGLEVGQLPDHVEQVYGTVLAVVATGSLLAGLGNSRSDLDLIVVVDAERLTDVPIVSFEKKVLVDVEYRSKGDVLEQIDRIRQSAWPDRATATYDEWRAYERAMRLVGRLQIGLSIGPEGGFARELGETLGRPWLAERFAATLRVESLRARTAARWLSSTKPRLACERLCDAVILALEARNLSRGRLYPERKWTLEKLRVADDREGERIGWEALATPVDLEGAEHYFARMEGHLEALLADLEPDELEVVLWPGPGVRIRRVGGRTLVSRWERRAFLMPGAVSLPYDETSPLWRGPLQGPPPEHLAALFSEDMTCLTIGPRAPAPSP